MTATDQPSSMENREERLQLLADLIIDHCLAKLRSGNAKPFDLSVMIALIRMAGIDICPHRPTYQAVAESLEDLQEQRAASHDYLPFPIPPSQSSTLGTAFSANPG